MKKILLSTLIAISFSAHAEKWVSIGSNMFVDSASQRKDGDIGSLTLKHENEISLLEFDCVNKKIIAFPKSVIQPNSPFDKAFKIACSKWFEVWK